MTKNKFVALCEEHGIDPTVALEDTLVRFALSERNDALVEKLLKENF